MKLNKWICAKKKANGLYFYKVHDEVKEEIRIPDCTLVSILDITFSLDVQLR